MDLTIPPELDDLRLSVRRFVSQELKPWEHEVEVSDEISEDLAATLRKKAVKIGVYGFNLPAEIGGGGIGALGQVLIGFEVGRTSVALGEMIGRLPQSLSLCKPQQREWLLAPALTGDVTVCVALTESEAGSDLSGIRTRAERTDSGWVLNGSKQFISHAETSDYIFVLANTDPIAALKNKCTLFAVARTNPGLTITHRNRKMGWRGYQISDFALVDCVVDSDSVIGEVNGGFDAIMRSINASRLFIGARCVGTAEELLKLAAGHANVRKTFGVPLGSHQAIQFKLADMDVDIESARMLVYAAAWAEDQGLPGSRIAAARAKLVATEMAGRVADAAVQIFGGAGYMSDLPVERMYRDMRGYRIGEGTSEIQRVQIARSVLKRHQ